MAIVRPDSSAVEADRLSPVTHPPQTAPAESAQPAGPDPGGVPRRRWNQRNEPAILHYNLLPMPAQARHLFMVLDDFAGSNPFTWVSNPTLELKTGLKHRSLQGYFLLLARLGLVRMVYDGPKKRTRLGIIMLRRGITGPLPCGDTPERIEAIEGLVRSQWRPDPSRPDHQFWARTLGHLGDSPERAPTQDPAEGVRNGLRTGVRRILRQNEDPDRQREIEQGIVKESGKSFSIRRDDQNPGPGGPMAHALGRLAARLEANTVREPAPSQPDRPAAVAAPQAGPVEPDFDPPGIESDPRTSRELPPPPRAGVPAAGPEPAYPEATDDDLPGPESDPRNYPPGLVTAPRPGPAVARPAPSAPAAPAARSHPPVARPPLPPPGSRDPLPPEVRALDAAQVERLRRFSLDDQARVRELLDLGRRGDAAARARAYRLLAPDSGPRGGPLSRGESVALLGCEALARRIAESASPALVPTFVERLVARLGSERDQRCRPWFVQIGADLALGRLDPEVLVDALAAATSRPGVRSVGGYFHACLKSAGYEARPPGRRAA